MYRCMYCLIDKPTSEFNLEHIIPGSFGKFKKSPPKLKNCVCRNCNSVIFRKIEQIFARTSYEGLSRYKYGIDSTEAHEISQSRVKGRVAGDPNWAGAFLDLTYDITRKQIMVGLAEQAGLKKKDTDQWVYFRLEELPCKNELISMGLNVSGEKSFKFFCTDRKILKNALDKANISINGSEEMDCGLVTAEDSTILVEQKGVIDDINRRVIAKIAFNYLTSHMGVNFVMKKEFNGIRLFIHKGKGDSTKYVSVENKPILMNEILNGVKSNCGHILTLETKGKGILGKVSLFNLITYKVCFSENINGVVPIVRKGLKFNIEKMIVEEIGTCSGSFAKSVMSGTFKKYKNPWRIKNG